MWGLGPGAGNDLEESSYQPGRAQKESSYQPGSQWLQHQLLQPSALTEELQLELELELALELKLEPLLQLSSAAWRSTAC